MQDRYAGDIGDFGKFGLLKELDRQGLTIGVNWYRTEPLASEKNPDGSYKQEDGKYTEAVADYRGCDEELADKLLDIAQSETNRSLVALEKAHLLPNAVYYHETISVENRAAWHDSALQLFEKSKIDLAFLDPDNGLLVPSVKPHNPRSVKYTFYEEVIDYLAQSQSVLVYNHRSRKREWTYFAEIEQRLQEAFQSSELQFMPAVLEITFPKYSIRDYFVIARPEHAEKIRGALDRMVAGEWGKSGLCWRPISMRIDLCEYRKRYASEKRFLQNYRKLPEAVVRALIERTDANMTAKACMFETWKRT